MDLKNPVVVYTAAGNVEALMIMQMLEANGIPAHAVEDQSGVSLWMLGTISQFHKPKIWVAQATAGQAAELIRTYEEQKRQRRHPEQGTGQIEVVCEECGKTTTFPASLDGTTQECAHCRAYVDVGDQPWDDDLGTPEE
jgi:hypothetical protein